GKIGKFRTRNVGRPSILKSKDKDSTLMREIIKAELLEAENTLNRFLNEPDNIAKIEDAAALISESILAGGKVLSCGNGGSHCDAMHFAEELTGRFRDDRRALPAIAISDVSHLSCVSNDY